MSATAATASAPAASSPPELREIPGPSAFGGGRRRFLHLLGLFAVTDFRLRYHGTALGYVWSLLRPLLLFAILYVVFTQVFRIGSAIPHYAAVLLLNIMLFQILFADATGGSVGSLVAQEPVVRKMQFPRLVIPLSGVLTSLLALLVSLIAVLIFVLLSGVEPMWTWLLFPPVLAAFTAFTAGTALLLSALYVRFRDIAQIWAVLSTALFYTSPVLIPVENLSDYGLGRLALSINPLAPLFELTRKWVIDPSAPAPGSAEAAGSVFGYIGPAAIGLTVCVLGFWLFVREAPRAAEEL